MSRAKVIRKQAVYPHPPERVWVALTDPHALAEWLMPNNFLPIMGHEFRFYVDPMPGFSGVTECTVLEIDPPRRMVWSWVIVPKDPQRPRHKPMTIEWTIEPEGAGTRLTLVHSGAEHISWLSRFQMAFGWGTMVKRWIPRITANVTGEPPVFHPGVRPANKRGYGVKTVPEGYAV